MNNPTKKELGIPWRKDHRGYIVDDEGSHLGEITCHDDFAIHAANQHHGLVEVIGIAMVAFDGITAKGVHSEEFMRNLAETAKEMIEAKALLTPHAPQEAGRDDNGPDSHPTPINDNEATDAQ